VIKDLNKIAVFNYNENRVSVEVAPGKSYSFEPSSDGETPTVIFMTIDEIRYANNSKAFKNGMLFFDKDMEEELYDELHIADWKNILTNDAIKNIILHPTFEGLSKIISIKDSAEFERVRAVFHKLRVENNQDISVRVSQIIETRYKELLNRRLTTSIELTKNDIPEQVDTMAVNELKTQNILMQEQIAKMQKMIEEMTKNNLTEKDVMKNDTKTGNRAKKKT